MKLLTYTGRDGLIQHGDKKIKQNQTIGVGEGDFQVDQATFDELALRADCSEAPLPPKKKGKE